MKTIKKTFKYRIYPTKEQETLLAKDFGAKRFVWNYLFNGRKNAYLENNTLLTFLCYYFHIIEDYIVFFRKN